MREQLLLMHAGHMLNDLVGPQVITPGLAAKDDPASDWRLRLMFHGSDAQKYRLAHEFFIFFRLCLLECFDRRWFE
jgi:hypothetical protein